MAESVLAFVEAMEHSGWRLFAPLKKDWQFVPRLRSDSEVNAICGDYFANSATRSCLVDTMVEFRGEKGQAFIEFDEEGVGKFQFGNVQGLADHYRSKKRDGKRLAQFSWDGVGVNGMPLEGTGWVILEGGEMSGTISIHLGDDLQFVAKRAKQHRVGGEEES